MPKRTTLTYTSEDAPLIAAGELYAYHCKYSGRHAFTLDCDLKKLPRRRTDGAYIVKTDEHKVTLSATDGGIKLLKRHDGRIESQHRYNVGKLPVAYRCGEEAPVLFVLDDAVATYANQGVNEEGGRVFVPPCIRAADDGAEVRMEVEDRARRAVLARVTADAIKVHCMRWLSTGGSNEEIYELMCKVLNVRLTQLRIQKGTSNRIRFLHVEGMKPREVYDKIREYMAKQSLEKSDDRSRF